MYIGWEVRDMKKKLYEIWKIKEGSKTLWKVQCPKGRLTFKTKKEAQIFVNKTKMILG